MTERRESTPDSDVLLEGGRAQRFGWAFDGASAGIVVEDLRGRIEYVNPAFSEAIGYTPAELTGSDHLSLTHPADRERVRSLYGDLTANEGKGFVVEMRYLQKVGGAVWMRTSASLLRSRRGDVIHTLSLCEDVTRRREGEEKLRQFQKLDAIGRLASGIAHDFNNLLTVIQGQTHLVLDALPGDSPLRDDLEEILQEADRAASLTRQLLAFGRRQILRERDLELRRVVSEIQDTLASHVPEGISLKLTLTEESCVVRADPAQLQEVVSSLVVNAVEAIEGSGRIDLEVDVHRLSAEEASAWPWTAHPGRYARLTVRDDGIGMSSEVRERVFEPFFTTKSGGHPGLGLSTVFGTVKQSGGHVLVESELGKGTAVRILVPLLGEREGTPRSQPDAGHRVAST